MPSTGETLWPQTPAEHIAGVTPSNYAWPSGPLRYGAFGNGVTDDSRAWNTMGRVLDHQFVPDRPYLVESKVQISQSCTIEGATRSTYLRSSGFHDYVFEIGASNTGPNSQAGELHRLTFYGAAGNTAILHMQPQAHLWRLDDLLFHASPCPALIVDNCWDSNYTNFDILQCTNPSGNAAASASVIVRGGCNNLYLRGVRVEQAQSGGYYIDDSGPIYVINGKVDLGYITQYAAAITITSTATALFSDWTLAGVNRQWGFDLTGSLRLHNVFLSGATGKHALIWDHRAWYQQNPATPQNSAVSASGCFIPYLDLGNAYFAGTSIYINQTTAAAVQSKIWPQRLISQVAVTVSARRSDATCDCYVRPAPSVNYGYNGAYLVLNNRGTQPGSRRKILASYMTGLVTLAGSAAPSVGTDYSLEFSGGHATPIQAETVKLDPGMDLFAVLQAGATISGTPTYTPAASSGSYGGMTTFAISASNFAAGTDATGYYLIDETTAEPFLIGYGVDDSGKIGVMYDRAGDIDTSGRFSIVAGYCAGVQQRGDHYEWDFAGARHAVPIRTAHVLGFDRDNLPLWGFQSAPGRPVDVPYGSVVRIDASDGDFFLLTVTSANPFTIENPSYGTPGQRITIAISNASGGSIGEITWGSWFRLSSFRAPAPREVVIFDVRFTGTHWRQVSPYVSEPQ